MNVVVEAAIEDMMIVEVGVVIVIVIVIQGITAIVEIIMIVDTTGIMDAAMTMIVVITRIAVLVVESSIHIGTLVSCISTQLVLLRNLHRSVGIGYLSNQLQSFRFICHALNY